MRIDLHLSFIQNTSIESIVNLKKQLQKEFSSQFGNCIVNIIVEEDEISSGKGQPEQNNMESIGNIDHN
jgi:divalent metal cation (Fe/Co/Zn/Cd) transporter